MGQISQVRCTLSSTCPTANLSLALGLPSQVRQNLERLSSLLQRDGTPRPDATATEETITSPPQTPTVVAEQEVGQSREQGAEKTGKDEF